MRIVGTVGGGADADGDMAVRASTKGSPSVPGGPSARRGDSMVVAGDSADGGWERLSTRVGAVRGRERMARPDESSITVTSVMGSEMSVRADEYFSGAETARWAVLVVMWEREPGWRGRRAVLLTTVIDGPGSGLCVSLRVGLSWNCGEKDLS